MLKNVWMAEVEDRLPYQTKSKVAQNLAQENMLQVDTTVISGVTVEGYGLTHAGRLYYCMVEEDDNPEPGQGEAS